MVRVKICGITNLEDALNSVNAGCDALGFVFYKKSPRYIEPLKAKEIISALPKNVIKIGVFVNAKESIVKDIAKLAHLNILQFHGEESPQYCRKFRNYKIIKAFRVKGEQSLKGILKYNVFAYLLDTFVKAKKGGTGEVFDWKLVRHLGGLKKPVFLSGGLNIGNVCKAIELVHPYCVDASTSLEIKPGKKDKHKIREFIRAVKGQ